MRGIATLLTASILVGAVAVCAAAQTPLDIGSRLELMADPAIIDSVDGGALVRLHHPTPREVVIVHDKPWEGNASLYHTVFKDGDKYRMYYRGWQFDVTGDSLTEPHAATACYAESTDGIHWTKPNLGIVEFDGSTQNNIVWGGVGTHNFVPFKDSNPNAQAAQRYKAVAGGRGGLVPLVSADGIHWELVQEEPVITDGAFDSQNLAFWDGEAGVYRAYYRDFREVDGRGFRDIKVATSKDFIEWTKGEWLEYTGASPEQLYTNQILPYYRAPHLLMGFPSRYVTNGWTDQLKALPPVDLRHQLVSLSQRYGTDITEVVFMSSRDGATFHYRSEAFIRPGPESHESWVYGDNYIAWGLVETKSHLEGAPPELSLYSSEDYWDGDSDRLRRYTLRIDGIVSVSAPLSGGTMVTEPFVFDGSKLAVNFASSAAGGIRVELQDASGDTLDGFALDDCPRTFGDSLERTIHWDGGSDVSGLAGKAVRLRVELRDADLYAFQFKQ